MISVIIQPFIILSKIRKDNFGNLCQVFLRCRKFGMSLNPTKCFFGASYGKLLGHIVFEVGINIDLERVKAIQNLPTPDSKKVIQDFMGKINFMRKFIPNFAYIIKHVHNLLKSNRTFYWDHTVENSFLEICFKCFYLVEISICHLTLPNVFLVSHMVNFLVT